MTDRDLASMLERASVDLPDLDFAEAAWADALAAHARRRRRALGTVGLVAAVGIVATVMQLGTSTAPRPVPQQPSTTTQGVRHLPDGTAYAVMPMEGTESQLPDFAVGLPSTIDTRGRAVRLSSLSAPPEWVVAVYLREVGQGYQPVLVTTDGTQVIADTVRLAATTAGANLGVPLGVRAFGGGGYVVFPQPRAVIALDVHTGRTRTFPVPAADVVDASWTADQARIIARSPSAAWVIDPREPGASAIKATDASAYAGQFRLSASGGSAPHLAVTRQDRNGIPGSAVAVDAPLTDIWGDTVNTQEWTAAGAFFDQNAVHSVIRRGFGPIYQGLVAAQAEGRAAPQLLLAPESPDGQTGRFRECCAVLGWADETTVLFRAYGSHGVWVLAWNVRTGTVYEVSRLGALSDSGMPTPMALNVGWRN